MDPKNVSRAFARSKQSLAAMDFDGDGGGSDLYLVTCVYI